KRPVLLGHLRGPDAGSAQTKRLDDQLGGVRIVLEDEDPGAVKVGELLGTPTTADGVGHRGVRIPRFAASAPAEFACRIPRATIARARRRTTLGLDLCRCGGRIRRGGADGVA